MAILGETRGTLRMALVVTGVLSLLSLSPVSGSSLYMPTDPIVQLTGENFYETIRNTPNAWFIEFYAHWCGHCKRLAPTMRKLSYNTTNWGHVIQVAAISCSHPPNVPVCRRMQVRGYPTLRFFPPYLKNEGYAGVEYVGAGTLRALVSGMVDYVSTIRGKPRAWPIMNPVSSVQEILQRKPADVATVLAIVENPTDNIDDNKAKQLLFDLSGEPGVHVMRLRRADIRSGVYELHQTGTLVVIAEGTKRGKLYRRTLSTLQMLQRQGAAPDVPTLPPPTQPSFRHISTNGLHMQDLESSLYHSLWIEVGSAFNISGPALETLKTYVRTLSRHFPGNYYIMGFLHQLDTWLQRIEGWILGADWVQALNKIQTEDAYVPTVVKWTGCLGSRSTFRGYPCSLWQTFHALTVNSLETNIRNPQYDSRQVLFTISDYIHHFFSCRECAQHFARMARNIQRKVRQPRDGVLWLWQAHNRVNKRLAGDETEDPIYRKQEFPTVGQCPTCRVTHPGRTRGRHKDDVTEWNQEEVMIFLRRFYGKDFVIPDNLGYTFVRETEKPPVYIPPETELLEKAELTQPEHISDHSPPTAPMKLDTATSTSPPHQPRTHRQWPQPGRTRTANTRKPWTPEPRPPHPWIPESGNPQPWTPEPGNPQPWEPEPDNSQPRKPQPQYPQIPEAKLPEVTRTVAPAVPKLVTPAPRNSRPWTQAPKRPQPITPVPRDPRPWNPQSITPRSWPRERDNQRQWTPEARNPQPAIPESPRDPQVWTAKPRNPQPRTSPPYTYPPPNGGPQQRPNQDTSSNIDNSRNRPETYHPSLLLTPGPVQEELTTGECRDVTTEWSSCSASCGSGVSTRMTTQMPSCKMEMESRICQLRPCNYRFIKNQWTSCGSTYRSANYLPLVFGECHSINHMKWRYCGECPGKCCKPSLSYTKEMAFFCGTTPENRLTAYANVEVIKLCACGDCA